jgi:hypothetical protein
LAGAALNGKRHVQAAQEHGVEMEEVDREDSLGLGLQEGSPGPPRPGGRRIDAGVPSPTGEDQVNGYDSIIGTTGFCLLGAGDLFA